MSLEKKSLLLFDFDQTIIDKDSEFDMVENLTPEFYKERNGNLFEEDWIPFNNLFYTKIKEKGYKWNDVKKYFEQLKFSPHFKELFDYLRKNKDKFDLIIITGNHFVCLETTLKNLGIFDLFKDIICNNSKLDEDNIIKIWSLNKNYEKNCKDCQPFLCKALAFHDYMKKNDMNKYEKIVFICDGGNDVCLTRKLLKENDIVCPRLNYSCYKNLAIEKKYEIKCKLVPWENGEDIIKILNKQ